MLTKMCARCKKLIVHPNRYCEKCKPIMENEAEERIQKRNSMYNKTRNKKHTQFYNSTAWRTLSKKYRASHKFCEECQREAKADNKYTIQYSEEVHHKKAIQTEEGWIRRLDWSNLIALCHIHHDLEHERFKRRKSI